MAKRAALTSDTPRAPYAGPQPGFWRCRECGALVGKDAQGRKVSPALGYLHQCLNADMPITDTERPQISTQAVIDDAGSRGGGGYKTGGHAERLNDGTRDHHE